MSTNRALLFRGLLVSTIVLACGEDEIIVAPPTVAAPTGSLTINLTWSPATQARQAAPSEVTVASEAGDSSRPKTPNLAAVKIASRPDSGKSVSLLRYALPAADSAAAFSGDSTVSRTPAAMREASSEPAAPSFERAHIRLLGISERVVEVQMANPTTTIDGLTPGEYTVLFEGFVDRDGFTNGEVDHFGVAQATVTADQNTAVAIEYENFRPVLDQPMSPTTATSLLITFPPVSNATAYFLEMDTDSLFVEPDTITIWDPGLWAVVWDTVTVYFRASAINKWIPLGRTGDVVQIEVTTDMAPSGDDPTSATHLGFGTAADWVLLDRNILPGRDRDWFAFDACDLDTVAIEVHANTLYPPSLLDSYLELMDASGSNVIAENDDYGETWDSRLELALPDAGRYYIRVRGRTYEDVGNYVLTTQVREGPMSGGTSCYLPIPTTIEVSSPYGELEVGKSRLLEVVVRDQGAREMRGFQEFEWSTSDSSAILIDSAGRATATLSGPVSISAALGDLSGETTLTVAAGPATAAPMVFSADWDGNWDLYLWNSDGTSARNLTENPASDWQSGWSPDGSKILFVSDRDGNEEVYVMNLDGTGQVNLTTNGAADSWPAWSRDGSRIAFVSDRGGNPDIWLMDAAGRILSQVTADFGEEGYLNWTPDGRAIVFQSDRDGDLDIYRIDADGTNLVQLTNDAFETSQPNLSPSGLKVVYVGYHFDASYLQMMDSDGTNISRLSSNVCGRDPCFDAQPSWLMDASRVVFESSRRDGNHDIYEIGVDGGGLRSIVVADGRELQPKFQPYGHIVAALEISGSDPDTIRSLGGTLQLTTEALDHQGNSLQGVPLSWRTSHEHIATVGPDGLVTAAYNGITSITVTEPLGVADSVTVIVFDSTITGAPASMTWVSGLDQEGPPGAALRNPLVVRVADEDGDGVPNVAVEWQVTGGDGSISPAVANTDGDGLARGTWTLGPDYGAHTAEASVDGINSPPVTFSATAFAALVQMSAEDMLYDPMRGLLYVSITWRAEQNANSILVIDPTTRTVVDRLTVGDEPGTLAISDDARFLYIAINSGPSVLRLDLETRTPDRQFYVQAPNWPTAYWALDMEVMPGRSGTVAISAEDRWSYDEGVVIFDDGVPRSGEVESFGARRIEFGATADTMFGFDNRAYDQWLKKLAVAADGVHEVSTMSLLFPVSERSSDITYAGGRIFTTNGAVIDPTQMDTVATLDAITDINAEGLVFPDPALGRFHYLAGSPPVVQTFDWNTFDQIGSTSPPGVGSFPAGSFVRWGASGLAFLTNNEIVIWETDLVNR